MVKVKLKDRKELEGLLRADAYAKHVESESDIPRTCLFCLGAGR